MDILQAAKTLRPGTSWNLSGNILFQAIDETPRVDVPTLPELEMVMASDETPEAITAKRRLAAIAQLTDPLPLGKALRAAMLGLLDEINLLRERDRDRAVDVAAATSLADLKTRWAARSSMANRTNAQAMTFIQNKVESGAAD